MANKPGEANFFPDVPTYPEMGTFQPIYGKFDLTTYIQGASDYEIMAFLVGKYNACLDAYGTITKLSTDTITACKQLQDWINSWFDNLDVQEVLNNKIDSMVQDGSFERLLHQTFDAQINQQTTNTVTQWLVANVTPTGSAVVVDKSLSIGGAAADAKVTGELISSIIEKITFTEGKCIGSEGNIQTASDWFATEEYYDIAKIHSLKLYGQGGAWVIAFYDKDYVFIGGIEKFSNYVTGISLIPTNAKYVRFCYQNKGTDSFVYIQNVKYNVPTFDVYLCDGFINTSGGISFYGKWKHSLNFIPLSIIDSFSIKMATGALSVSYYDKDYNFINGETADSGTITDFTNKPENAVYVKFSTEKLSDYVKINYANLVSTLLELNQKSTTFNNSVLQNKKIVGIGDSMMKGHTLPDNQTWLYIVSNMCGAIHINLGYNGSRITDVTYGENTGWCNEYTIVPDDADYIVIECGTNDITDNVTIGSVDSSDKSTLCGAMNVMLNGLITDHPKSKICFISPYIRNSEVKAKTIEVVNALKMMCSKYSIPFFDNTEYGGINFNNEAQYSSLTLQDGYHLNYDGMLFVATKFKSFIESL